MPCIIYLNNARRHLVLELEISAYRGILSTPNDNDLSTKGLVEILYGCRPCRYLTSAEERKLTSGVTILELLDENFR
jgi:hypothetical protein